MNSYIFVYTTLYSIYLYIIYEYICGYVVVQLIEDTTQILDV